MVIETKDIIHNLNESNIWKTKLTLAIKFMFSKDTKEERVMHSKSDNIEIMTYNKTYKVIEKLFESIRYRYQTGLEEPIKSSDFVVNQ